MTEAIIRKQVSINAPVERVWEAVANAKDFGTWFGCDFAGATFEPGATITAVITDPPEYTGVAFPITVVAMEAPRVFSFRWHPGEPEPDTDPAEGPTTLVEFRLEPEGSGTRLTVTESGFEAIPAEQRAKAFRSNEEGWGIQVQRVKEYVGG